MKKLIFLPLILALLLALYAGCAPSSSQTLDDANGPETTSPMAKAKGETIPAEDADENGGADAYGNAGDNASSRYYINPDFYRMKSDENLTLIEGYKTMQQTTEWSCGDVAALTVLNHFGITGETEYGLAEAMGSHTDKDTPGAKPGSANNTGEYGTNVEQLYRYFSGRTDVKVVESSFRPTYTEADLLTAEDGVKEADIGNLPPVFTSSSLYASENSDETEAWVDDAKDAYFVRWIVDHLKANRPIMVEWGDWDGHWQVIIGYDNNGTPSLGDDILIFADPYDTSDHWQDGYYYYPLERWFYMWKDRGVAPKPFQLQPYIVIDKVS